MKLLKAARHVSAFTVFGFLALWSLTGHSQFAKFSGSAQELIDQCHQAAAASAGAQIKSTSVVEMTNTFPISIKNECMTMSNGLICQCTYFENSAGFRCDLQQYGSCREAQRYARSFYYKKGGGGLEGNSQTLAIPLPLGRGQNGAYGGYRWRFPRGSRSQ
jgi:hypothetical protein